MGSRQQRWEGRCFLLPFVASHTGKVTYESPSRIRRGVKQARMGVFAPGGPGYCYRIYPASPERTSQAKRAIAIFVLREKLAITRQNRILRTREIARRTFDKNAENALQRRIRRHQCELLIARGLPLSTPIEALALPKKSQRVRFVANGYVSDGA